MMKMKSGDTVPIASGAGESAIPLILALGHPCLAAKAISILSLVQASTRGHSTRQRELLRPFSASSSGS